MPLGHMVLEDLPLNDESSFSMLVASLYMMESCRCVFASLLVSVLLFFNPPNKLFFGGALDWGTSLGSNGYG